MELTARQIADSFRIRGSATIEIVAKNTKGELPEGAKTHCKKWLKEFLFKRREELKNKYVAKGNESEEDGFTLMAVQLKLGMVYKNTEKRRNDFASGECDLHHNKVTYDNKCSWSLDTFPMFETEIPDPKYWWQLQNYSTLWPSEKLWLCYTLISSSFEAFEDAVRYKPDHNERYKMAERMVYSKAEFELMQHHFFSDATLDTFVEIPEEKRIKSFEFEPDSDAQKLIETRSYMCREYIYQLLIKNGYK